ncbi:hypothetical protein KEM52_003588 [Ascosphaera acerosa]|nr:hypothetical protein KEM52_003588 [Ascosphaera acerosa]
MLRTAPPGRQLRVTRELLPAHYATRSPTSHSIFNTLIIDGDSADGSRALRRRTQAAASRTEAERRGTPSPTRRKVATMSPAAAGPQSESGRSRDVQAAPVPRRSALQAHEPPSVLASDKAKPQGTGGQPGGGNVTIKKEGVDGDGGDKQSIRRLRLLQQRRPPQGQQRCIVLRKTRANYVLVLRLPPAKLRRALASAASSSTTSLRPQAPSSMKVSFKRKSQLPLEDSRTAQNVAPPPPPPQQQQQPPPLSRNLTRFPKPSPSPFAAPFYSFPSRANEELKAKPYGGILTPDEANTTRTLPQALDRARFERARTIAETEWRLKMEAAEQAGDISRAADTKVSGPPSKIKCVNFGGWEIETWYAAPYPEEYSRNRVLYICEFCLKYMNSAFVAWRHKLKCPAKHPPGDEIYRDGSVSIMEVDGRKNPVYCQNLCLLAKLFLGSKTLYYDVEPFLFYVMTECDDLGHHFVGYFSKEKRVGSSNNVSCILTLPIHQRKGYGNLLIDFSYLLTRVEGKTGSPEKPLSDMGLVSYRNYWRLVLSYTLRDHGKSPVSISELGVKTGMTPDDIVSGLEGLRALVRDPVTKKYALRIDYDYINEYIAKWERKGYVKLNPDALVWTPYLVGRTSHASHPVLGGYDCVPPLSAVGPREDTRESVGLETRGGSITAVASVKAMSVTGEGGAAETVVALPISGEGQGDPNAPLPDTSDATVSADTGDLKSEESGAAHLDLDVTASAQLPVPDITTAASVAASLVPYDGIGIGDIGPPSVASSSLLHHHQSYLPGQARAEDEADADADPAEGIPPTRFEIFPPPHKSRLDDYRRRGKSSSSRNRASARRRNRPSAATAKTSTSSNTMPLDSRADVSEDAPVPQRRNPPRAVASLASAASGAAAHHTGPNGAAAALPRRITRSSRLAGVAADETDSTEKGKDPVGAIQALEAPAAAATGEKAPGLSGGHAGDGVGQDGGGEDPDADVDAEGEDDLDIELMPPDTAPGTHKNGDGGDTRGGDSGNGDDGDDGDRAGGDTSILSATPRKLRSRGAPEPVGQ